MVNEFSTHGHDGGYLACVIAILYFLTVYGLQKLGSSTIWKSSIRGFLADYAYPVGILCYPSHFCSLFSVDGSSGVTNMVSLVLSSGLVLRTFRAI